MSTTTLDTALLNRLQAALEHNRIADADDLNWLATGDNLALVRQVRLGLVDVTASKTNLNCNFDPHVPAGYKVVRHYKDAVFTWDEDNIGLYEHDDQGSDCLLDGYDLRKVLERMPALNANVLDYLLANQDLIPKEWEDLRVFFWGTLYRGIENQQLRVRYMFWDGDEWCGSHRSLNLHWEEKSVAVIARS